MPSPTTDIPITEPPAKATRSAGAIEARAAFAVRTLAAVATRIPNQPATAEQSAPIRKERPTSSVPPPRLAT